MKLNQLRDNPGATKKPIRVGRGIGSGKGKTSGRGVKGQKARSGVSVNGFEGGQMPLFRRLPKRGFNNPSATDYAVINLGQIQTAIDAGKLDTKGTIDAAALKKAGLISKTEGGVRLLAQGELKTKINMTISGASETAVEAVKKAGGQLTLTVGKKEKGVRKPVKTKAPKVKGETKKARKAKKKAAAKPAKTVAKKATK